MATIVEQKTIGIDVSMDGSFDNTEIVNGELRLKVKEVSPTGNIYESYGSWTSKIIDIGDKFKEFEKVVANNIDKSNATVSFETRTSDNGVNFNSWTSTDKDNYILSEKKRYIQLRINLNAGTTESTGSIIGLIEDNEFIERLQTSQGSQAVPNLTSNTSSTIGTAFASSAYSTTYGAWKAFNSTDANEKYLAATGQTTGHLGFMFNSPVIIKKYAVRSAGDTATYLPRMIKDWILQGSNDTTDGTNGTWIDLDTRTNQTWTSGATDKEYEISNFDKFKTYRINWSSNNGNATMTSIGQLKFYTGNEYLLQLKRDYDFDMTNDTSWANEGALFRKTIHRDNWLRINKLNVKD